MDKLRVDAVQDAFAKKPSERETERARVGVLKTTAPSDLLPKGVDDLTPGLMSDAGSAVREHQFGRIFSRLISAGFVRLLIS